MEYVLTQMEKQLNLGRRALPHQISILDTVYWVSEAWKVVENNTITKCFEKTGFSFPAGGEQVTDGDDNINNEDDDIPLSIQKLTNDLFGFELSDLVKLDQEVNTFDNNTTIIQLLQIHTVFLINLKSLHSIKEMLICWKML